MRDECRGKDADLGKGGGLDDLLCKGLATAVPFVDFRSRCRSFCAIDCVVGALLQMGRPVVMDIPFNT